MDQDASRRQGTLRQRGFAWGLAHLNERYEKAAAGCKRRLFSDFSGTVVEIGPGAGAHLPYFPRGVRWIGIEPNPAMDLYIELQARALGMKVEICREASGFHWPRPASTPW
jgi:hypothetical protein